MAENLPVGELIAVDLPVLAPGLVLAALAAVAVTIEARGASTATANRRPAGSPRPAR